MVFVPKASLNLFGVTAERVQMWYVLLAAAVCSRLCVLKKNEN